MQISACTCLVIEIITLGSRIVSLLLALGLRGHIETKDPRTKEGSTPAWRYVCQSTNSSGNAPNILIAPDGLSLCVLDKTDPNVAIWNTNPPSLRRTMLYSGEGGTIVPWSFTNARLLITGSPDGRVEWWDPGEGKLLKECKLEQPKIANYKFSRLLGRGIVTDDGFILAVCEMRTDEWGSLKRWFYAKWLSQSGKLVVHNEIHTSIDNPVCRPDGILVLRNLDSEILVHSPLTNSPTTKINCHHMSASPSAGSSLPIIAISRLYLERARHNNSTVVSEIQFYDTLSGRSFSIVMPSKIYRCEFANKDRFLIALSRDSLHVWDLFRGREICRLPIPRTASVDLDECPVSNLHVVDKPFTVFLCLKDGSILECKPLGPTVSLSSAFPLEVGGVGLDKLLCDLGSLDFRTGYSAMVALAAAPENVLVQLANSQLRPVDHFDVEEIPRNIQLLSDTSNVIRDTATRRLVYMGELARSALENSGMHSSSPETVRRSKAILENPSLSFCYDYLLMRLRFLKILESCANKEARELLLSVSKGVEGSPLTTAARKSLMWRSVARDNSPAGIPNGSY
jgi:hypothetical protein